MSLTEPFPFVTLIAIIFLDILRKLLIIKLIVDNLIIIRANTK